MYMRIRASGGPRTFASVQENFVSQERCFSRDESLRESDRTGLHRVLKSRKVQICLMQRSIIIRNSVLGVRSIFLYLSRLLHSSRLRSVHSGPFSFSSSINSQLFPRSHRQQDSYHVGIIIPIIEIITANRRQLQLSRALIVRCSVYSRRRIRHVISRCSAVKAH